MLLLTIISNHVHLTFQLLIVRLARLDGLLLCIISLPIGLLCLKKVPLGHISSHLSSFHDLWILLNVAFLGIFKFIRSITSNVLLVLIQSIASYVIFTIIWIHQHRIVLKVGSSCLQINLMSLTKTRASIRIVQGMLLKTTSRTVQASLLEALCQGINRLQQSFSALLQARIPLIFLLCQRSFVLCSVVILRSILSSDLWIFLGESHSRFVSCWL